MEDAPNSHPETAAQVRARSPEQLTREERIQTRLHAMSLAIEHHKSTTGQIADNQSLLKTAGEILEFLKSGDTTAAPEMEKSA
jgi:hypothetical protein